MKNIFLVLAILFTFQILEAQPTQCFTAIHCDPSEPENFPYLEKLVDSANAYNIKLTLEFTGPWVDSISPYNYRKNKIIIWHNQGHEIAMHHHDLSHPMLWDGYTNHSMAEIQAAGWNTNNYKGDMEFLYNRILSIAGTAQLRTIGNSDSVDLPINCIFQTQGILDVDGFSNPVANNYNGKNYCTIGYTYINGLSVLNAIENFYPSMTAFNILGSVFHVFNFKDNSLPMMNWFRFVNDQGMQAKTVAQILISLNCPPIVGMRPDNADNEITIYPNPFKSNVEISFDMPNKTIKLEVYDIQGRLLEQKEYEQITKINFRNEHLNNGIYFFKFTIDKNDIITKKVTIMD